MPLRALLLMPSGEQPTNPSSKQTSSSRFRRSQNTSAPRIVSPQDLATARLSTTSQGAYNIRPLVHDSSRLLDDNSDEGKNTDRWSISSKPLPSPPPRPERDSNQTYQTTLTLPSTSGSSSRSGTDHAPSPPLSPSPTSSTSPSRRSTGYDTEGSSAPSKSLGIPVEISEAKHIRASERFLQSESSTPPTLRLKLPSIPTEHDERGRPILKVNTLFSRIGSSIRYSKNETYRQQDTSSPDLQGQPSAQPGEQTARKAVSDRIRHLVSTTNQSSPPPPQRNPSSPMTAQLGFSFLSPLSSPSRAPSPTPSRPQSLSPSTNHISVTPSTALPPLSSRRFTRRKSPIRRYHIAPAHPPPPPTKGVPPFKILSDEEMLELLGEGYIRGMTEGRRVTVGWEKLETTRIRRPSRPKGTKGKYIRLITLPPLVVDVSDESMEGIKRGERSKGLQPSIRMELDEETEDGSAETSANTFVPTVYMTELLASQYDIPVACMMWPPLSPETFASAMKAHKRPISAASMTHSRHDESIHQPPAKAYQFPIHDLTRLQRSTLQAAKLLVYAVPPQYIGPIPPPELEVVKDEVVAPWANTQFSTASSLVGIVEESMKPSTPRLSAFPSGALSPRWGPTVEGLWNKPGTEAGKKRTSAASMRSVESNVTAPGGGQETKPTEETGAVSEEVQTTSWSTGFSSLRSRAQDYYTSRTAAGPPVTTSQLSTSISDPANMTSPSSSSSSALSPPSATSSNSVTGSRSFGSFFSRSASSTSSATSAQSLTLASASASIVPTSSSPASTSVSASASHPLKVDEFGFVAGADSGSFVFDGDELVPKDVTLGASSTSQSNVVGVAVEAPLTTQSSGWRGWGARWGRGNQ